MLVFWVALLAITNTIGVLFHLYQLIMQTYYTKKSRKEQSERDKRDDAIGEHLVFLQKQVADYMTLCSDYMEMVKKVQKKLEEQQNDNLVRTKTEK